MSEGQNSTISLIVASLAVAFTIGFYLYQHTVITRSHLPPGLGPDELAHIDNSYFQLRKPFKRIKLEEGLYTPGLSPIFQGHQAPLSYIVGAGLLKAVHHEQYVGPFYDYQAGLVFESDPKRLYMPSSFSRTEDSETKAFRQGIFSLRSLSAVYFSLVIFFSFIVAVCLYPSRAIEAAAFSIFAASTPTGIWQSFFVNNDIAAVFFTSITFLLGGLSLLSTRRLSVGFLFVLATLAAAAFLSKYSGVSAFASIGFLIILKPSLPILMRLKYCLFSGGVFFLFILPELVSNYLEMSELFPTSYMKQIAQHLNNPHTIPELIRDPFFLPGLFRSFWINFYTVFPSWPHDTWYYLLYVSAAGYIFYPLNALLGKSSFTGFKRGCLLVIYSLLQVLVITLLQLWYAQEFPIPDGRYVQTGRVALMLFVFIGISNLFCLALTSERLRAFILLFSSLALFVAQTLFANSFSAETYKPKFFESDFKVSSGLDFAVGDIDGDEVDELVFFHRARTRVFFANADELLGKYSINPSWTRKIGLFGDQLLVGNVVGSELSDLVFWRHGASWWNIVDGRKFVEHDAGVSKYRDFSANPETIFFLSRKQSRPFLVPQETESLFAMYHRADPNFWQISTPSELRRITQNQQPVMQVFASGKGADQPFLFSWLGETYFGSYRCSGGRVLLKSHLSQNETKSLQVQAADYIVAVDMDSDGKSEIISWNLDQHCLSLSSFQFLGSEEKSSFPTGSQKICFNSGSEKIKFSKHSKLFAAQFNSQTRLLAVNFLDGTVNILLEGSFPFSNCSKDDSGLLSCYPIDKFDPQW